MTPRNNNDELGITFLEELTLVERALITGTLLGDAHIQKRDASYRLKIAHSIDQKDYVRWKYTKLQRLCKTTQEPKVEKDKKGFETVLFYTSSGKWLREFHELFYQPVEKAGEKTRYVKRITQELIDKLPMHPIVLAAFFMDDGSVRNDCYAGKFATQGFSKEENHLLTQYFKKWNIDTKVVAHKKSENKYYISVPAKSFGTLVKIIEPIVREVPYMAYKLNEINKPRND